MNKKRIVSFILAIIMIIGVLPLGDVVYAADKAKVKLTNVYTNFSRTEKRITIEDKEIKDYRDKKLQVESEDNKWHAPKNVNLVGQTIVEAELDPNLIIRDALIEGKVSEGTPPVDKIKESRYSGINEKGIPEILNVDKPSVKTNDPIILNGKDNVEQLTGSKYTITVGGVKAEVEKVPDKNQVKLTPTEGQFPRGLRDIVVRSETDLDNYTLETASVYKNAVRIAGELGIEGTQMFPTMGEPGSKVTFKRATFPDVEGYDIYFIRDLNNAEFIEANMGKNQTISLPQDDSKESIITVEVPNVRPGPYHVVFTNKNSQKFGIDSIYVIPQQYQVVTISQKPTIDSVQPDKAPSMTPTIVEIKGNFFTKHNIPGFDPSEPTPEIPNIKEGDKEIQIKYGDGTLKLPDATGKMEDHSVNVEKKIEVDIGRVLNIEGFTSSGDNKDSNTFKVKTDTFTLEEAKVEDVVIRVTTIITGDTFNAHMEQEVVVKNGFTYFPPTEIPNVNEVIPNIIPIEEDKTNSKFYLDSSMGRLLISIEGENFLVTRYVDEEGEKVIYPKVTLAGVVINPNAEDGEHKPLKFEVLNDGSIVDGTLGNEIGNRILIELKAGKEGFEVLNKDSKNVHINNPNRQSKDYAVTDWIFEEKVRFELINKNNFPVIENVRPSLVSIDGGEDVVVTGSNFRPGAKVYIENRLVPGVNISGDGKVITFKAPKGSRPGETLLQVINPEGGIASHVFTYTKTYTQPRLNYINPKEGATNTLVTVKGENFLAPDPTIVIDDITQIDESLIYRLIGTRIFMDGYDINEYNRGEQNRIELQPFQVGEIFEYDTTDNKVVLGNSYDSVVLFDKDNYKFYSIVRDIRNDYFIEGGEGIRYKISYESDQFKANDYDMTLEEGEVSFNNLTLEAYTPFKIEDDKIVGNRVSFVDSNTLNFRVANLNKSPWTGEGYYDVSVVNPDTKRETIRNGFYFYASSSTRPIIVDVIPDRGPEKGGNIIHLIGPEPNPNDENDGKVGFMDTGTNKTEVFIGGQKVPNQDVIVHPGGRKIELKVPATIEKIKEKGTDRITVPIVVVNPDGGTFSISYENPIEVERKSGEYYVKKAIRGYTYLVPTSNPKINDIYPKEGSAAGGYILEIFGSDFRDFEPFVDTKGDGIYEEGMPYDDIDGNGEYTYKAPDDKAKSKYNPEYEYLISPILPKVYFGTVEAEVVKFGTGYLQVVVPPNIQGTVDLYVVNNDSGISNKVKYNYLASNPSISHIIPGVGKRHGGERIEIHGANLENNKLTIMRKDSSDNPITEIKHMPLVRFGENSNENLPRNHENSGVIRSDMARVSLNGGIEISYDARARTINATLEENKIKFTNTYEGYNGEEIFINTKDLKSKSTNYPYEQLIRLKVDTNRLFVSANYGPVSEYRNGTQIGVTTPAYYTVGIVPVEVINPDGGIAKGQFEYKNPDSKPKIHNITRDGNDPDPADDEKNMMLRVDYRGGHEMTVLGKDFREGAVIKIGNILDIPSKDIIYTLNGEPNKLTFKLPAVNENAIGKLYRLTVINEDGGSVSSDDIDNNWRKPIYIQFTKGESNPSIESITPDRGPTKGGTKVIIKGNDFRDTMEGYEGKKLKVYFGEHPVPTEDINVIDYKTIEVITPPGTPGRVEVKVENPDGTLARPSGYFTYISGPIINNVEDPITGKRINHISVKGGQELRLKGQEFLPGARVVFAPKLRKAETGETGQIIYIEGQAYILEEGLNGTNFEFIDEETVLITTPQGKLGDKGVIIINPDGGASPIYDIVYDLPEIEAPEEVIAELVFDKYIKVHWQPVPGADYYEIYEVDSRGRDEFIGSTELTSFLYKDIEPRTTYRFLIKAVGEFGSSPPSMISNRVRTGSNAGYEDKDGELGEKTTIVKTGQLVNIGLGSKDYHTTSLNLKDIKYKGTKEIIVSIPLGLVYNSKDSNKLTIIGEDFNLAFSPNVFKNKSYEKHKGDKNAGIRLKISYHTGNTNLNGKTSLSNQLLLEGEFYAGKKVEKVKDLSNQMNLKLNYDIDKANLRKITHQDIYYFDDKQSKWILLPNTSSSYYNEIGGNLNKLGRYAILGHRR